MKKFLYILLIGGLGGVMLNNLILPFLIKVDFLNTGNIFNAFYKPAVQTLIKTQERVLTIEPDFWRTIVSENQGSVGFIQAFSGKFLLSQGPLAVLTSDGLLVTTPQFVPPGANIFQILIDNKILPGKVVLRDFDNSIAFVKIEGVNLKVFDFASSPQLGQSVILIAKAMRVKEVNSFVQIGIIKEIDKKVLFLDTFFNREINGAGVFSSKGEFLGLARTNVRNQIFVLQPELLKKILNNFLR